MDLVYKNKTRKYSKSRREWFKDDIIIVFKYLNGAGKKKSNNKNKQCYYVTHDRASTHMLCACFIFFFFFFCRGTAFVVSAKSHVYRWLSLARTQTSVETDNITHERDQNKKQKILSYAHYLSWQYLWLVTADYWLWIVPVAAPAGFELIRQSRSD